jgi:hypothetical protein
MSKTYYTEKGWHLAAIEDPRNPSFNLFEITICKTGDLLVVCEQEYNDIDQAISEIQIEGDQVLLDGDEFYGNVRDPVTIYKIVD